MQEIHVPQASECLKLMWVHLCVSHGCMYVCVFMFV